jgi:hypothetical protein
MAFLRRVALATSCLIAVVGCSPSAPAVATPTTEPPAFDLAAVQRKFTDECNDPIVVDGLFCEQVHISGMSAEGTILKVPTTLNAAAKDRAGAICVQIAAAHRDGNGKDLGYETVGVLDRDGAFMASCPLD